MQSLTLAHLALATTPAATIDAAADAGFGAVGVRICARRPGEPFASEPIIGNPATARALRDRAAGRGIRLSNISAYQFYPDVTWDQAAPAIDATAELGAPIIVANCFDSDTARFTELLARYCEKAAASSIRVALEFLPYSAVRNLDSALRIVEACAAPNAGVLLDALHLERSGGVPADIGRVPAHRVVFAQLCDARRSTGPRSDAELLNEARTARLPAGTGELPLFGFLDALPPGTEIEYEVARADLAHASPREKALAAHEDAKAFMRLYDEHRAGTNRARSASAR